MRASPGFTPGPRAVILRASPWEPASSAKILSSPVGPPPNEWSSSQGGSLLSGGPGLGWSPWAYIIERASGVVLP